ncbi:aldo/keto reductase [Candidatus Entotheonella palauensis]|nr:aldo/keto reductase [Candidatus Entotheonella palauensis]
MDYRTLGKTDLRVSALGFGCGNVGGLMIRSEPSERERAVARALELGINYFDTAAQYGNGQSEKNLGQVFKALKPAAYVGTKFRLTAPDMTDISGAINRALEASLKRLDMEKVDLFQLHNQVGVERSADADMLSVTDVTEQVIPTLHTLKQQGKIQFCGMTGLGETPALHQVIDAGGLDTVQVCYNLLNPSAGYEVPPGYPAQDYGCLLDHAQAQQTGVIVIRVLAARALSGVETRHPIASSAPTPIGSGPDYGADVQLAQRFNILAQAGHVQNLVEAALRFPLSASAVSTVLLGYSTLEHLEFAAESIAKGPLSPDALSQLSTVWSDPG